MKHAFIKYTPNGVRERDISLTGVS